MTFLCKKGACERERLVCVRVFFCCTARRCRVTREEGEKKKTTSLLEMYALWLEKHLHAVSGFFVCIFLCQKHEDKQTTSYSLILSTMRLPWALTITICVCIIYLMSEDGSPAKPQGSDPLQVERYASVSKPPSLLHELLPAANVEVDAATLSSPLTTSTAAATPSPTVDVTTTTSAPPALPPAAPTATPVRTVPRGLKGSYFAGENHRARSQPVWVPRFDHARNFSREKPTSIIPQDPEHELQWLDISMGNTSRSVWRRAVSTRNWISSGHVDEARNECRGSWRLPANATRFCRAYDGRSSVLLSPLRRLESPPRENLLCDSTGTSPLVIHKCDPDVCGALSGCLLSIPSGHCPAESPTVVIPFVSPSKMPELAGLEAAFMTLLTPPSLEESTGDNGDGDAEFFDTYPARLIQDCADVALQSYCSHAFQLVPVLHRTCDFLNKSQENNLCHDRRKMTKCIVYRYYHHPHGALQPLPSQPMFAFMHRSEWRPSLMRDDLRLVIIRGPDITFRINPDGYQMPWIRVAVRRRFGELVPRNVSVTVRMVLYVKECPLAMGARNSSKGGGPHVLRNVINGTTGEVYVLARRQHTWVSPSDPRLLLLSEQSMIDFWVPPVYLAPFVGCKLVLRATGTPIDLPTQTRLPLIRKEVESLIQYDSVNVVLVRELVPDEPSTLKGADCAAHIREDECCFHGIIAYHLAATGERAAFSGKWGDNLIFLSIRPVTGHTNEMPHPCISIEDGHVTSFDFHGVAVFPRLVMRNRCQPQELQAYQTSSTASSVVLELRMLRDRTVDVSNASVVIPLSEWDSCLAQREPAAAAGVDSTPITSTVGPSTVVLFSIAVHESITAVAEQLENIAVFSPESVVVLHISPFWNIQMAELLKLNGTAHPLVFIHNKRLEYSKHMLAQVQLRNALYMEQHHPWVRWTHVVLFASNELLVRPGIAEYVASFDMSSPLRPSLSSAVSVKHSFFGGRPDVRFVDPEFLGRGFNYWGSARGDGGLHGEFGFTRMMRNLGLHLFSTHQIYTEGSFFRREIAVGLSQVLDAYFDYSDGDCLDSWMSPSEAFMYHLLQNACNETHTIEGPSDDSLFSSSVKPPKWNATASRHLLHVLQRARCGERTGTVSWQSPYWHVTEADVRAVRCSPFPIPFSLKRFDRNSNNPIRKMIVEIQNDKQRNKVTREAAKCLPLSE